jgi:hypothetical protein
MQCHSIAWHYSNNQPQPIAQRSINVVLLTVGVDWLNTMEMAAVAAAAAGATNSQRIHGQEQQENVQITPPRCTCASKTGTTATLTVAMLTMGTPAGCVPNGAPHTIHTQQGPTR